jgi:ABC-2 type transport system permease protein
VGAERPGLVVTRLVSRRALRGGLVWGMVFGLAVASSVEQFTTAYDTDESRRQIAGTIGGNGALRALFGSGRALETVPGWTAWRSLGIVTILGSIWALLAATRWLRGEEDSGRWELLVAGPTTRRRVTAQAVAALGLGLVALWTATAAVILVVGRVPEARFGIGESLFLAVTLVAPAGVFLAAGAFASQLAPTRRQASRLAAAGFGVAFLLRVVGNSEPALRWVQWLTPVGWVQHLQPLTGSSVLPLVPLVLLTGALVVAAIALAGVRDVGAGVLSARDFAPPRTSLLGGPVGLAVRLERGTSLSWAVGLAAMSFLFGVVSSAVATTSSDALEDVFARLGARDGGLEAYLGTFFLIIAAALAFAAAGQVAAIRDEEAQGHVATLLVHPIGRLAWLSGRLAVSAAVLVGLGLIAGAAGWAGAASQHAGVSPARMAAAGLNIVPAALAVLGLGTLAHGLAPRRTAPAVYGLVAWSFVVELLGTIGTGSGVLLDLSLFHHVGLMPAAPFRTAGAAALVGLGAAGMLVGAIAFNRRDLVEA